MALDDDSVVVESLDPHQLLAEVHRLRGLIGPDELAYEQLRVDLEGCERAARDAELRVGELRGQIVEIKLQLGRARQEQEWALTGGRPWRDRLGATARRARTLAGRVRPARVHHR